VLVPISISLKLSVCRTVSEIFSVKKRRDLETGGRGRSRSLEMEPIYRSYDFLLVGHCKYSCTLYHFQVIWCIIIVTLKRSLKVIQTGTIRKIGCSFLFTFHSNCGRIFNRLWDIQRLRIASVFDIAFGGSKHVLLNSVISNDLEWLSKIFNDTKRRTVSLRQLSFLFIFETPILFWNSSVSAQGSIWKGFECYNRISNANFLTVFHSNYGSILLSFWDVTTPQDG